jgi:uncharacterized protein YukE
MERFADKDDLIEHLEAVASELEDELDTIQDLLDELESENE